MKIVRTGMGKDIKYPVEIINIQKKINDQLGLYRGARKLIGLSSILAILFFMTIYADRRKVTIRFCPKSCEDEDCFKQ